MSDQQACAVPLMELLRHIPENYRAEIEMQWASDGTPTGHHYIPVGRYAHEAAATIAAAQSRVLEQDVTIAELRTRYLQLTEQYARLCDQVYEEDGETLKQDTMRAAMKTPVAEWLPIESAPENHLPILIYGPYGQAVAFRDVTWAWWPCPATEPLGYEPTHWQPLPSPPK